jgi:glyoxylase I family protein
MPISPKTSGIHHIALRCNDIILSKKFYQEIIGLPLVMDTAELIAFVAGSTIIVFRKASLKDANDNVFNPFNIGMDHIALGCETEAELERVARGLKDAGVENTGVKFDDVLQKKYVAFKDPDRIQWEFYMTK